MLHSRLRPLPRRQQTPTTAAAPRPDFQEEENDDDEFPEDLFSAFLPHLFPDDAPSFHGDPGQRLLYTSPLYGDLEIMVPSYPGQSEKRTEELAAGMSGDNEIEEGRKLFAHFLWSAAMVVAEGVEKDTTAAADGEDGGMWTVKGESVLELGAGAALPSLLAALAGASTVAITDHPSSPAFAGAISHNITANIPLSLRDRVSAHPHEWGVLETPFALANKGTFTRIIAADCLWMRSQHENLVKTMLWFLAGGNTSSTSNNKSQEEAEAGNDATQGKIWVIAGFHTGRAIVASFFETAVRMGLVIESIYERDLLTGTDVEGEGREVRREWMPLREGEGPENRRRWCVVAVLRRGGLMI